MPYTPVNLLAYVRARDAAEASARELLTVNAPVDLGTIRAFARVIIDTMALHRELLSQVVARQRERRGCSQPISAPCSPPQLSCEGSPSRLLTGQPSPGNPSLGLR